LFQFSLDKAWGKYKNKPVTTCTPNITSGLPSTSRDVNPVKNTELNEYLSDLYSVKKRPRLEDELQDYLAEPREPSDSSYDNLSYWKAHTACYPRLSCMARDYLAITATSASSERVFSTGKDLLGICRFCLKPTTMEACMCLRSWLRAGIKLMDGQDANVSSSQEPLRGSKSTTEADSIPVLSEGADNTGEYEVVYVTEEEEWSESDVYSTEDNDFALEYFQKK
jgi:hypothetical protein